MKNFLLYILLLIPTFLLAQSSYNIQFKDELVRVEENIDSFQWGQMPASSKFQNGYYGWIQFYKTPNQKIQNDFKNKGLELMEYLPNKAYVFYFPKNTSIQYLKDSGVRAIVPIEGEYKLSSALKMPPYPDYALEGNNILVTLAFHDHTNSSDVIEELVKQQIAVKKEYKGHNVIDISVSNDGLEALTKLAFVKWIELKSAPTVSHDTRGKGLHRSNGLDTQTAAGRNYTGEGIGVMVRDDGIIGPHIDFEGRLDNRNTSQFDASENHGDGVAGIMAGAGNLDPSRRGMAAGSDVYNADRFGSFLDFGVTSLFNDGTVQITNTSSGPACQNDYTLEAVIVDQQINEIPSLLHVFSAGNTNFGPDCGYGAGNEWANLGGADKIAKNVMSAANVIFNGTVTNSSARGPASDGRIKPDIAAHGDGQFSTDEDNQYYVIGGTSAASPGIAGIAAQLYEAYGDQNDGALPQSALIKAIMLNAANDAGNVGPDFTYGWGIVNGLRAGKTIEDGRYLSDNITQGATNNHVINVPSGTAQVRFMVYWRDVTGALGASPALVNDLDLVVNDPANNALLPWILDSTPDPVALNTPATTGVDHLNNMEQVLINDPAAGDYSLDISGFNVPMGPQEYFVVYEIIADNVTVTYPNGEESFVAGEAEVIHWDAIDTDAGFNLEYSIDNGGSWTNITTVPANTTNYVWSVPSSVTGSALIRVSSGSFTDTSDIGFSIAEQVDDFAFSQICPGELTFVWDAVTGAESYDVYLLGEKYMEVVGNSTTTSLTVAIADPTVVFWAAIVAKNDTEGWKSLRTNAINSAGELLDCPLANDIAAIEVGNNPDDFLILCADPEGIVISAVFSNTGTAPQSNFEVSYQLDNQAIVTEMYTGALAPGEEIDFVFDTPLSISSTGSYPLTISVNSAGDQNEFNDAVTLDIFALVDATALDFEEDFETNGITPSGWSIINDDDEFTWAEASGTLGSDGNITTAAFVDNFAYNAEGEEDFLVTEFFDLTEGSEAVLSFDLAKAQWNSLLVDRLRVEISIDCGETFIIIYDKTGLDLSTLPGYNTTDAWAPSSADHWRNEQIDLTPYIGEVALFRFVNTNGWSNNTYIDNINLDQTLVSTEESILSDIRLFPNPAKETVSLTMNSQIAAEALVVITNISGQTISYQEAKGRTNLVIDVSDYMSGFYFVTITSMGVSETKKLIIQK